MQASSHKSVQTKTPKHIYAPKAPFSFGPKHPLKTSQEHWVAPSAAEALPWPWSMAPSGARMRWRTGPGSWPGLGATWGSLTSLLLLLLPLPLLLWITFWWSFLSLWYRRFRFRSFWDITVKNKDFICKHIQTHSLPSYILEGAKILPSTFSCLFSNKLLQNCEKELQCGTMIQKGE